MFKKSFIFLFLATAYTVLLAHNFTPHHHDIEKTTHHHHGQDHHHDDHEDGNGKNTFHLFQHFGTSGVEFIPGQFIKYHRQKKFHETAFIKLANIFLSHFEKPPLIVPFIKSGHLPIQQTMPHFFPLKAPPTYTA